MSGQTRVFDAVREPAEWDAVLDALPTGARDVYHGAPYLALHAGADSRAVLFTHRLGGELWAYPFLLSPIRAVGGRAVEPGMADIEGAYGYGGPVGNSRRPAFLAAAHGTFREWCREQGVVAEFARLHPLIETEPLLDSELRVVDDRETASLALDGFAGGIPFHPSARREVGRAERSGVSAVFREPGGAAWDAFVGVYLRRMAELGADAYYRFTPAYFARLRGLVASAGWLVTAERDGGEVVGAAVFLRGGSRLHYHLSASEAGAAPGTANLLVCAAGRRGFTEGLRTLHLGGGRTSAPDDSLLRFKKRLATHSHRFRIGMRVHDPRRYEQLREQWRDEFPALEPRFGGRLLCYRYGESNS